MKHLLRLLRSLLTVIILLGLTGTVIAQRIQVSGKVTDAESKETMVGVTVLEKGTQNGTATDINGMFKLSVKQGAMLEFSFIGYEPVQMAASENMNIQLKTKQTLLNQVVVVGYGTQNKREVTGAIYKVKGSEITALPVPSFEAGLQGRASGVMVTQSSGLAGAGSNIKIRGVSSINAGGDPLYVIDGVIIPQNSGERIGAVNTNPLNTINPDDIESVDILKDASATAIYGSRGANGVILITTKHARLNEGGGASVPLYDIGYRTTLSTPTKLYDLVNTEEYVKLYTEGFENDKRFGIVNGVASMPDNPNVPMLPGGFDPRVLAAQGYPTTDWQKEMVRVGVGHAFDASMTYGNKRLASFVSVGYHNDESYLKKNSFNLFSVRANLDYKITDKLTAGINASYSHSVNNLVPVSWNGGLGKAMSGALPYWPIYADSTHTKYYTFPSSPSGSYNPVAEAGNRIMHEVYSRTISNIYLNYNLTKDLSIKLDGGADYYNRTYDEFFNNVIEPIQTRGNQTSTTPLTLMGKILIDYKLDLTKDHKFKFLAGEEVLRNSTEYNVYRSVTFAKGDPGGPFFQDAYISDSLKGTQSYTNRQDFTGVVYGFVSFFGRANYSFKDRYLLNVSLRRDASSRFGKNNKWGTFPSASIGWILTEENFMKGQKLFNYLKVKAGYGKTGNAEIDNNAQWGIFTVNSTTKYGGEKIRYYQQLPNPNLRWETTNSYDIGLEFGIWKDRINGSVDYYYKETKDLFLNARVQTSSGLSTVLMNVGSLWNKGIEFSLNSTNVKTKNFSWSSTLNMAWNQNEVSSTGNAGPDAFASTGDVRVLVGYPIGVNYLVKELGVDPATGQPIYEGIEKNEKGEIIRRFKTFTYSTDYRQPLGKPYPDWVGGFINNFTWKRWDMMALINFQLGGNIYDDSEKFQLTSIGGYTPVKDLLDRWQQPGDVTDVPRMTLKTEITNTTRFLHDATYARLKNVSIGYNFPVTGIKGIRKIRVAFTATNLLTWTTYNGMDPEIFRDMENQQQRNLSANVTYYTPPQARTYSLSINVNL